MSSSGWSRVLWGVVFSNSTDDGTLLLGSHWDDVARSSVGYEGEPARALLFQSRAAARRWCKKERARYEGRTDCCAYWRFRVVRVRESVVPA